MTKPDEKAPKDNPDNGATKDRSKPQQKLLKWERRTIWPMFVLSVIFVTLQMVLLFDRPNLRPWEVAWSSAAIVALWLLFVADFLARLYAQQNRRQFVKDRWFEVASLVVPVLRPAMPLYYLWRTPYFLRATPKALRLRYQITIATAAVMFLYVTSTAVFFVEKGAKGATITTWPDSLWWGIVTVTTVGYGHYEPVTFTGRILGSFMMVAGMFLIGVVSASFVSYLSERLRAITVAHTVKDREVYSDVEVTDVDPARVISQSDWAVQASKAVHSESPPEGS